MASGQRLAAFAICAIFGGSLGNAQTKPNLGSTSVLFHRACAVCHGLNGNGGRGPDLVSGRWSHGSTDADLARVITNGVPGTDMPAFGQRFNQEEITKLVAFVRSLSAGGGNLKITGNAERGQEIYWGKGACSSCHMVNGQGGTLGPELSRIGAQRSPASLKESIVSPSAAIVTGYQTVKVTQGGRTITGIRKNEDNYSIQVFDGNEYHSFDKSKIDRLEEPPESLMPASNLSASEVDDLVAYLDTLRAPQQPMGVSRRGRR
ncbi:MAG TPA: c-type cytochrome [Bryobacterales bacterium]|jgi:cytochrome c oxidase cbb3-type subunit 3|nr:c-type cytochrome [Bryobacterales bacterium]